VCVWHQKIEKKFAEKFLGESIQYNNINDGAPPPTCCHQCQWLEIISADNASTKRVASFAMTYRAILITILVIFRNPIAFICFGLMGSSNEACAVFPHPAFTKTLSSECHQQRVAGRRRSFIGFVGDGTVFAIRSKTATRSTMVTSIGLAPI